MSSLRGFRLVGKDAKPRAPLFHVNDAVPADGVYCAYHNGHRLSHEVTLLAGETFPPCVKCGYDVKFELLRQVADRANDADFDFKIRLYQLPHPEEPDEK